MARPRPRRRSRRAPAGDRRALRGHLAAVRARAPDPGPGRLVPVDARSRDGCARPRRAGDPGRRQPDRRLGPQARRGAPPARRPARRADGDPEPRPVRRPPGPGDSPRAASHPSGGRRRALPRPRSLQARQRHARSPGRRPAADRGRAAARVGRPAAGHRRPPRRRRVHRPSRRRRPTPTRRRSWPSASARRSKRRS